jgi:maltose alpha-D-glucosyltransferase/alpha-amylase
LGDGKDPRELAVVYAFLLTMPGVPFIYYGDEIGMRSVAGLPSKEGGFGRTGARTPMQWDASPDAGFSTAPAGRLYLPIDSAADRPTVAAQEMDPHSTLNTVRTLIALRQAHPALQASGAFAEVVARSGEALFVYERASGGERIMVAVNPAARPCEARLPATVGFSEARQLAGEAGAFQCDAQGWTVQLPAVSYAVVEIE